MDAVSRRDFLAAGTLLLSARSYSRIVGANDRIQIGLIGCGHRSAGHRQMLKMSAETDPNFDLRSEEHTSELQSRSDLVCRLLLEKKKKDNAGRASSYVHARLHQVSI